MKKQYFIILLSLLFILPLTAQKELTLEQAVLGQYQTFYPEHIVDFQWIKDTKKYSYPQMYRKLMVGEVGGQENEVTDVWKLNEILGTDFMHLVGLKWRDANTFVLQQGKRIAIFNIKTKVGSFIELPDDAENATLDYTLTKVAYTKENNLYYSEIDVFEEVEVAANDNKNIVSGQTIARDEMGINGGIFWSPDGNYLAFYEKDESNVHDYPLLNNEDVPGTLKIIKYPMVGQGSEVPRVGIYHLETKNKRFITTSFGKNNYLTNLKWTPDEDFLYIVEVNRKQNHFWFQKYNNNGEFVKTFFEESSDSWVNPTRTAYFPNQKSNDFVWISERDGFDNIYYYSTEGILISQLTNNKFVVKDIVATHLGDVYFTATGESPLNTLLYKVNLKGKQVLLTEELGTHDVSLDCTREYIFDQYSAHDIPNKVVIRDNKGKIKQTLIAAENPLADYALGEAEIKTIKSNAGFDLYTRMIKPKNFNPSKKYPVLVYVYGGPHVQLITNSWLDGASLWMYYLANQGYLVFTVDNRGSAYRGVDFEHGIYRQLGVLEHQDQMTGVDYLKSLPYVDAKRLAVHGWSFGGFMTGTMMLRSPGVFNVGVSGGPVTDWKFYEVMYGERYMDTPEDNPEGYKKTSLIEQAENLQGKYLIIHGSIDPVVVMQHSLALIEKFVDLGIQMDFFVYPMHEHNVRGKDRVHLMRKVIDYVIENNQ